MRVGAEFIPRTCIRFVRAFIANAHPCATRCTYIRVRHFIRAHWLLFVSLLVLTAVALTVARLWVPTLGNYHHEVEAAASKALNRVVTIGRLEATWRGLGPVLKLKNVVINGSAESSGHLDIQEVWISLDIDHYIAEGKVRPSGIDIIGADLGITRDVDGRIFLEGFQGDAGGGSGIDDLLQMHRLSINDSNITITDLKSGEPSRRFSDVTFALINDGYEHTLTGYALLPVELGYRVDVEAELSGKDGNFEQWQGQVYVKGQTLALPEYVARGLPDTMSMQGIADIRLWFDFSSAHLQSVRGEIDAHDVQLENNEGEKPYRFLADTMQGQFGWQRAGEQWQMTLQDFSITQDEEIWETENLSLAGAENKGVNDLRVVTGQIQLDGLGALLRVVPGLTDEHRRLLVDMHPRGDIYDFMLALERTPDTVTVTDFSAGFSDISFQQSDAYPSVSGLAGDVKGTLERGVLTLHSQDARVQYDKLFREALSLSLLHGHIHWQTSGKHLEFSSDSLRMENGDLTLQAAFGVDVPAEDIAPSMHLQLAVEQADMGRISRYLPAKRMRARGVSWLDRSLVSGDIADGTIVINGRLDQIPFDNNEGQLEVRLPVKNAVLDFNKDWSPLVGLDAQVNFTGRSMDILSQQGVIRNASLENVHVRIRDLAKPVLTLTGAVDGQLSVMLAELGSSPLGDTYGGFVDRVDTAGKSTLDLDLRLPLYGKKRDITVSGLIKLADNELRIKESTIALKKIKGTLVFDDSGIRGNNLAAQLYGKPAVVKVWSGKEDSSTHISLDGKLGLLRIIVGEKSALYPAISGNSDWNVELQIKGKPGRGKRANVSLYVNSTLAGTAIDLPAPFGKDSDTLRELSLKADRIDYPEKQLRLRYGNLLDGLLVFAVVDETPELQRGAIRFGGGKTDLPADERLLVSGSLKQINTTAWKPYLGGDSPGLGIPVEYELDVDELEILGHYVRDVSLHMEAAGLVWNIKAGGPSISGDIELTKAAVGFDKVVMNLQRLAVESDSSKEEPADDTEVLPEFFPNLQIVAQQLVYNDIDLGNFQLATEKQLDNSLKLKRLILSSELLEARMSGSWRLQDGQQRSSVDVGVTSGKMDELLKAFGYQESIEGGELSGSMRAAWPGPLWAFSPPLVEGQLDVKIENGQLVDLEPGAAGRVLGLLSLSNLPRRLLIDFSDVFGDGFSFDKINGSFVVEDGDAYTSNLYVKGPAAKIEVSGRVGLAARDYDQLISVTPTVKTPLSLAGTLVGGPVVGAAIIVAETLLEGKIEALNKMVRTQYTLTGPWSDPVFKKIGSSDTSEPVEPAAVEE
jgi:uncharacterized protein (TIGR02099 family)